MMKQILCLVVLFALVAMVPPAVAVESVEINASETYSGSWNQSINTCERHANLTSSTPDPTAAGTQVTPAPDIAWQNCLGGSGGDYAFSIRQTSDGGYVVAGHTSSSDGDVSGTHGYYDAWVVNLDAAGTLVWQKCFGGSMDDYARSVQQTSDGGYVFAGYTESTDGDVSGNHDFSDAWVVKLDAAGTMVWQLCLGGPADDYAYSIQQTSDGGYIVAGCTQSSTGNVFGNHGYYDGWVVKLDATGTPVWQRCLGGSAKDCASSIWQTSDGGYVVAGYTESTDGDVSGNHGYFDAWVVKLNVTGTPEWQRCLGGLSYDSAESVQQTSDGGYIITGLTQSTDGDVSGNHGSSDIWVVKLDATGTLVWQRCLGGSADDYAYSIRQTSDGGYVVAGHTRSSDGDVSGNHGSSDIWVVKLDATGTPLWKRCLGGSSSDCAYGIQQTSSDGYVVAGLTQSTDGDVSGNHGSFDIWVVKLGGTGATGANFTANVTCGLAPLTVQFTDTSTSVPTSWSWDFGDGATATEQNPVHTYTAAGNYTVSLSLNGGEETCTKSAYVRVMPVLFGDANGNGAVNQADTLRVLKEIVGLETKPANGTEQFKKTDVSGNGIIEINDALFIAQYNVGLRDVWFVIL